MHPLPSYRRQTIWTGEPAERTLCVAGDLNRDGVPEIVIAERKPARRLYWLGRAADGRWQQHIMDDTCGPLEAGGCLADLDGDGDLDFVAGGDYQDNGLYWWECPPDPTQRWTRREICRMPANVSHDQLVADLDGDGRPEVYFWNQKALTLFCVPVPADPRVSPWPGVTPVMTGEREEGLAAADVDGDGRLELIAGQSWYHLPRIPGGPWERHIYATDFVSPRVAAADFDGDGRPEIILAEGDASIYARRLGRVARFTAGPDPAALWQPEILHDALADPHSLAIADFDGDGRPDLFIGELGSPDGNDPHPPAQRIFLNRAGRLVEHGMDRGLGTHEAKAILLDGRAAIAGKPYRNYDAHAVRNPEADSIHLWVQA